jgi:hypothetical protein
MDIAKSSISSETLRHVTLNITSGRAFVGLNRVQEDPSSSLQLHVHFGHQRILSHFVMADMEPAFQFQTKLNLPVRLLHLDA